MRVLMILDNLSGDSGVSSIVMSLYKNIDADNIVIDFLAFKEGNNSYLNMVESRGSKVYILPNPLSPKSLLRSIRELKAFFKTHKNDYDTVHLHSPSLNEFTLKYAKRYSIPNRIIHSHSTMTSPIRIKKYINSFLQRNVTKYATHFFSCSSEAANFLYGKEFCEKHEIELVKNAVDTDKFRYSEEQANLVKREYGIGENRVAIHISNFSRIKNVSFIVPVIKKLITSDRDFRFLFVGDGPIRNDVEALAKELGVEEYCIFTGRRDDVARLINCADVLLLPSLKEGLPVTVVEAQANGMKCLVSNTVTREANAGNVIYLPLEKTSWVEALKNTRRISTRERLHICDEFEVSEFNITNEAKRLKAIYLSMEKNV